jgi:PAS domain S-box-containing protein
MVRTDGSTRWLTARGEASRDTNARIVGLRGTVQDVTERKRREESLVLFRSLIDGSNDALEVIDPNSLRFLDVNEKACRDLGYSRDELLSMTVLDIDPSLDEVMRTAFARQCREAGFVMFESQHRRKGGSAFPVEVSIKSIAVGGRSYNVCVVRDITERKVAQEALRESEERFRLAAEAGRMFAYTWDVASDVIVRSGKSEQIIGIEESIPLTCGQIFALVHPDDRDGLKAVVDELSPAKPLLQISYRMIRPDGSVIWVERHSRAYFDDNGRMLRTVGMVADVTQRKLAEEALSSVSRRLIDAQEGERARIARELHDDIGQRLAILAVTLDEIKLLTSKSRGELGSGIDALQRQTSEISSAIHALSHELHSSKLELLGAVVAMRGFCAELSGQQKVEVDFSHKDVPQRVPPEIALCLFRVMQEALHNAVRHSGVRQFAVQLEGTSHALRLTVRDEGVGFDAGTTASRGLGLTSMKERLKLVGGTLSIQSQLKQGSTIVASVPFQARAN